MPLGILKALTWTENGTRGSDVEILTLDHMTLLVCMYTTQDIAVGIGMDPTIR